jgi:hypothetical protein
MSVVLISSDAVMGAELNVLYSVCYKQLEC